VFEWLIRELASIRTPRFHIVDGLADSRLREAVANSSLPLPSDYREFVLAFGNTRLFRNGRCGWTIGVFAGPRIAERKGGALEYVVGHHDDMTVYYRSSVRHDGLRLYEAVGPSRPIRPGEFEDWLAASYDEARRATPPEKWAEIVRGPSPFSREEKRIVEQRKRFKWRVLEIDPSGDHVIEVSNGGNRTLPVLSIGVRSVDGRLNGGIRLNVAHVLPGETAVLRANCYKQLRPPGELKLFSLPDPQPEERDYYPEFHIDQSS